MMTQMTAEPANETMPVWSPDGKSIVYQSDRAGADIYRRDAQGAGQAERLTQQGEALEGPHSMTPEGRVVFGTRTAIATVLPPATASQALVTGTAPLSDPRVSPDGRYLAYQSRESGRFEIYVTNYPPRDGRRWRVSTAGGTLPRWARSGRELFFVDEAGLMMVPMDGDPAVAAAGASRIWTMPASAGERAVDYDVAPDGSRFLAILEKRSTSGAASVIVVRNWLAELRLRLRPSP
jgi:Tol biopolymer transport system component